MLVGESEMFVKTGFADEAEIENVVQAYAEQLFGSTIVYLSQARISTIGGRGTIPDAVVIDLKKDEWYVVEAERAVHGTWEHIAPQVSRQLAAVAAPHTVDALTQMAIDQIRASDELRTMLREVGISELEVHGRLRKILRTTPTIAIPIDGIPKDLAEWARTLRNEVKIWLIEKYVSTSESRRVLYSLPDDNLPTFTTSSTSSGPINDVQITGSQPYQELLTVVPRLLGTTVVLEYGPRGGERRSFRGIIRPDGIEVDGSVYSPSYAAVRCMQQAGSSRKTANGWLMWRTEAGEYLDDIYQRIRPSSTVDIRQ